MLHFLNLAILTLIPIDKNSLENVGLPLDIVHGGGLQKLFENPRNLTDEDIANYNYGQPDNFH